MKDWASLPLRLSLGVVFVAHGLQKAFGLFGGLGIQGFAKMLTNLGFANPILWAYAVAYVELIGGLCLLFGLFTRIASIPLLIYVIVAGINIHLPNGFFFMNGGFEYSLVKTCALISLLILGSGRLGINRKL